MVSTQNAKLISRICQLQEEVRQILDLSVALSHGIVEPQHIAELRTQSYLTGYCPGLMQLQCSCKEREQMFQKALVTTPSLQDAVHTP